MEREKIKGYLNISRKAGYLIIGGETLEDYKKKLFLVLYDKTAANNTLKVVEKIKERGIKTIEVESLGDLISLPTCKIVGIKNKKSLKCLKRFYNKNYF